MVRQGIIPLWGAWQQFGHYLRIHVDGFCILKALPLCSANEWLWSSTGTWAAIHASGYVLEGAWSRAPIIK